ncbi:hypothetical protein ACF0H5_015943 [Mactra antiquata]
MKMASRLCIVSKTVLRNINKNSFRASIIQKNSPFKVRQVYQLSSAQFYSISRPVVSIENGETIIRSPYPDVEPCDKTFGEFILSYLDEFKNLELMVDYPTGRVYTGAQMKEYVIKVASCLTGLGYKAGDVALLFSSNCLEYPIIFTACSIIGVTVTTANPVYTAGELSRQLEHSETDIIFTQENMVPLVQEAVSMNESITKRVKDIVIIDGSADKCRPFQSFLDDDGTRFPENVDIDPRKSILALPYSSGTTGLPKGVMLSHFNMISNLIQAKCGQMKFKTGEDVLLGLLPFYHIYGMMVLQFGTITQGCKLIVHPKFEPETFLQSIEDYKISYSHLVPAIALFLAKSPIVENYNISSLKTALSAAAPFGLGVTHEVENRLNINMLQAYGLTECSPLTHYDEVPQKHGTIGRLVPSTVAKIVDPISRKCLNVGETGEILLKGPQVMLGYLKNQEATDKTIDKDGWLATGDIGHSDSDGYFTISDRLKELIKYKGFQVAPAELEALLCTHPSIQDAAVIGIEASEDVGEVPKAFVVTKPGEQITQQDILDFVEKNVAPYKKLRGGVSFIDQVPKTASGKILRRMLKDQQ